MAPMRRQTRSRTRNGATPPPSVAPFAPAVTGKEVKKPARLRKQRSKIQQRDQSSGPISRSATVSPRDAAQPPPSREVSWDHQSTSRSSLRSGSGSSSQSSSSDSQRSHPEYGQKTIPGASSGADAQRSSSRSNQGSNSPASESLIPSGAPPTSSSASAASSPESSLESYPRPGDVVIHLPTPSPPPSLKRTWFESGRRRWDTNHPSSLLQCTGPVLDATTTYLDGKTIHNLIKAAPWLYEAIRSRTKSQTLRCDNHPNPPMIKVQDPFNQNKLTFSGAGAQPPFELCRRDRLSNLELRPCEGVSRGFVTLLEDGSNSHGPDFLVCQYCVQNSWLAYSMFVKHRSVDLCYQCSKYHILRCAKYAAEEKAPPECSCLIEDVRMWLCTACRRNKSEADEYWAQDWIASEHYSRFAPMHLSPNQQLQHPGPISLWSDPDQREGESLCLCGKDPREKIQSYTGHVRAVGPETYKPLVRLCLYCRKQRFITGPRIDR